MNKIKTRSFIVDVAKTMVDTNIVNGDIPDNQRLYCKCGGISNFNQKIKRNIISKHNTTVEDKTSVKSIKCHKCNTVFDKDTNGFNKPILIIPDEDELYNIVFSIKESKNEIFLERNKYFARFNSQKDSLILNIVRTDYIKFNTKTKLITLFLEKPSIDKFQKERNEASEKQKTIENVSCSIKLTNIAKIEDFFVYYDFVIYNGLEEIYSFFSSIDSNVNDIESIKQLSPSVRLSYTNHKVEIDEKNDNYLLYLYVESEYNDGKQIKQPMNIGGYLNRFCELSKIFFSVINFPNITTILLTKKYSFFKEFINSNHVVDVEIYNKNEATSPIKIMEVSMNLDSTGKPKSVDKEGDSGDSISEKQLSYLKLSPLLYKQIRSVDDLDLLLGIYRKRFDKTEIETIFNEYEQKRVFNFFALLNKQRVESKITYSIKNVRHIFDKNIDVVDKESTDYLHLYKDTINLINQLEFPSDYIFKIKDFKQLKLTHDDLASRYNAIKDAKKSDFYKKVTKEYKHLNCIIDEVEFTVIPTLEDLNKEGTMMHHCVYSYLSRVVDKDYMVVHVQHILSNERATMGLQRHGDTLTFEQLKGYLNGVATSALTNAAVQFLTKNNIKHNSGTSDLNPNSRTHNKMSDYRTDEEVMLLRKEMIKKEQEEMELAKKEGREYIPKLQSSYKERKKFFKNILN
jgi:hypothetical protein